MLVQSWVTSAIGWSSSFGSSGVIFRRVPRPSFHVNLHGSFRSNNALDPTRSNVDSASIDRCSVILTVCLNFVSCTNTVYYILAIRRMSKTGLFKILFLVVLLWTLLGSLIFRVRKSKEKNERLEFSIVSIRTSDFYIYQRTFILFSIAQDAKKKRFSKFNFLLKRKDLVNLMNL